MSSLLRHDAALLKSATRLVGVDEAGRGALAGPVVAAACVIGRGFVESRKVWSRVGAATDSKRLSASTRESIFRTLFELREEGFLDFAVAEGSVEEIEEHNILGATILAMRRAVEALPERDVSWRLPAEAAGPLFPASSAATRVLVDGRPLKRFPYVHEGLVGGDGRSLCIALASIAAKVTRDRRMCDLDPEFPPYGLARHKGYGTAVHRRALAEHGPSVVHRKLFLRKVLGPGNGN